MERAFGGNPRACREFLECLESNKISFTHFESHRFIGYDCCGDQEWTHVADFGHTAGFDFDLGRCANCGAYLLEVAYAYWPTIHVIEKPEAESFLRLDGTPELRKALRRWVGEG